MKWGLLSRRKDRKEIKEEEEKGEENQGESAKLEMYTEDIQRKVTCVLKNMRRKCELLSRRKIRWKLKRRRRAKRIRMRVQN